LIQLTVKSLDKVGPSLIRVVKGLFLFGLWGLASTTGGIVREAQIHKPDHKETGDHLGLPVAP
jgi:hypothetical protein